MKVVFVCGAAMAAVGCGAWFDRLCVWVQGGNVPDSRIIACAISLFLLLFWFLIDEVPEASSSSVNWGFGISLFFPHDLPAMWYDVFLQFYYLL